MTDKLVAMVCLTIIAGGAFWFMPGAAEAIVSAVIGAIAGFVTGERMARTRSTDPDVVT